MHRLLLLLLTVLPLGAQSANFLSFDDYVTDWKVSRQFTLAVAQKMPEVGYSFKATPEEMTFGEQMVHIALSLYIRFAQVNGERTPVNKGPEKITKAAVIDLLGQAYDYALQVLPKLTNEQLTRTRFVVNFDGRPSPDLNGREMLMNMLVHAAHHRAQCEVYLRLKGITPPDYTF